MRVPFRFSLMSLALSALALAPVTVALSLAAPGVAYAKNEKSNDKGGGKDKGDRDRGNKDKAGKAGNGRDKPAKAAKAANTRATGTTKTRQQQTAAPAKVKTKGSVASQLKWMNAAHASLNAYANANPNSRVGKVATYRAALLDYRAAAEDPAYQATLEGYRAALTDFAAEGTSGDAIEAALAALQGLDAAGEPYTQDDVDAILAGLNPDAAGDGEGTDDPLAGLREALSGVVESDNALQGLAASRDEAFAGVTDGLTIEEGSDAWNRFHDLLRLDQPLPERTEGDDPDADDEDTGEDDTAGLDDPEGDDPSDDDEQPLLITSAD